MDGGAWWAAVRRVAKSQTQLSNFPFTFHFHASEKEMATHSSVLAWRIPGMGEPGGMPSMGSHRVRHNWSDLAEAAAQRNRVKKNGEKRPETSLLMTPCALVRSKRPSFKNNAALGSSVACFCCSYGHLLEGVAICGEGNGNPLQYCRLGNPMDRGAWKGYSPWGRKESDRTDVT